MNFKFKRAEDSPGFLLWQLTNQWQREQRHALKKLGLTHPQFVVLAGILWLSSVSNDNVTQKKVSEFTKIDKMSMSDLVTTLVKKKLLNRSHHKEDRRAHALQLTSKGHERVIKAIPVVEGIDDKFFQKETHELVQLLKCLKHLM